MNRFKNLLPVICLGAILCSCCCAQDKDKPPAKSKSQVAKTKTAKIWKPDLLVVRDGWQANPATVKRVLESTARELCKNFPDRKLPPIIVYPKGGPIVLFDKGPGGEIFMKLNTGKTFWAQYAFQFAHEFCHVLCRYDRDPHGNRWLEETLCETASLYALRQMGTTWKTDPPHDHWKDYAKHLTGYAKKRIEDHQLPKNQTLAQWYAKHADDLRKNSTRRELNTVAAVKLLKLLEENPRHWRAVAFLNKANPKSAQSMADYLSDWYKHSPRDHKPFVNDVAQLLGISISKSADSHAESGK